MWYTERKDTKGIALRRKPMVQKQLIDEIVRIICELRDGDVDELARYDLKLDCNVTKEHPWKRLCSYKSEKDLDSECDKSLRIMIIFWLSFGFNRWKIRRKGDNFELRSREVPFVVRGDVMHSYATTARIYLSLEGVMDNKRQNTNGLVLKHYNNEQMLRKLYETNTDFAEFIKLCHTVGNILPCPSGDLNCARGIGPSNDYFDIFLMLVQKYFEYGEGFAAGVSLFPGGREFSAYISDYNDFDDYIRRNFLQRFVKKKSGAIIVSPLWMSESTNFFEQFVKGGQALLPINSEQCTDYFHNAGERIIARGKSIIKAVKSRLDEYEKAGIGSERLAEDMCTRV